MAHTKTSTLTDTIPTVIEEARFTQQFKAVMAGMCWNIKKELHEGSTVNVPYWGIVTAHNLVEGTDMANPQEMEDTNVPITPGEVGCQIVITDKCVRDDQEDVIRAAGRILGEAMEVKRDTDLLAELDDGTNSLGSSSTATMGIVAAARALLSGNAVATGGPAPMPYAMVHHPYVLLDLVDVLTPTIPYSGSNSSTSQAMPGGMTENVLKNYTIGRLFGMPVVEDGNLTISSSVAKGGVFATGTGGSIILATADEWDIEDERDASLRATELNIVGEYGVGEYLAGWIVELACNAGTPA